MIKNVVKGAMVLRTPSLVVVLCGLILGLNGCTGDQDPPSVIMSAGHALADNHFEEFKALLKPGSDVFTRYGSKRKFGRLKLLLVVTLNPGLGKSKPRKIVSERIEAGAIQVSEVTYSTDLFSGTAVIATIETVCLERARVYQHRLGNEYLGPISSHCQISKFTSIWSNWI